MGNSSGNCIVSADVIGSYNEDGGTCANCYNGGNADGIAVKFGAWWWKAHSL